ncbi:uncharacterized protein LOC126376126 [Pectinophora gossypiella]|uniref:uncharacterized protein LOC126376126 n=1 Tax=Pectinophora gossypiella TaxID=13191 RepID=UPI00214EDFDB|nr:uncharacterized protein LOC126376126 [Pectinophora gossypiella]XP_049879259.1 uncharacterized protein LOC126376126 [Pectinophora gossypiella]
MGQEQSYVSHASVTSRRYKDHKYEDPIQFRGPLDYQDDKDYKRHKVRRSGDSFKSDHTESSGYRSSSSTYECRSDRSSKSEYYCTSLYKNDHYKDVNKEIYKPVKITKEQRYKLQLYDDNDDIKSERLKSYLSDAEQAQKAQKTQTPKKAGIRNYTPKILSEEEQRKKIENWI